MKKALLYTFIVAATFVWAIGAFSLHKNGTTSLKKYSHQFSSSAQFSNSTVFTVKNDVVNVVDSSEDEENFSSIDQGIAIYALKINSNRFYAVNYLSNTAKILSYYSKNLSRVPRFNFLSLCVIRI